MLSEHPQDTCRLVRDDLAHHARAPLLQALATTFGSRSNGVERRYP